VRSFTNFRHRLLPCTEAADQTDDDSRDDPDFRSRDRTGNGSVEALGGGRYEENGVGESREDWHTVVLTGQRGVGKGSIVSCGVVKGRVGSGKGHLCRVGSEKIVCGRERLCVVGKGRVGSGKGQSSRLCCDLIELARVIRLRPTALRSVCRLDHCNNQLMHRPIGRYRRSKHRQSMTFLKLMAATPLRQLTLTLTLLFPFYAQAVHLK